MNELQERRKGKRGREEERMKESADKQPKDWTNKLKNEQAMQTNKKSTNEQMT